MVFWAQPVEPRVAARCSSSTSPVCAHASAADIVPPLTRDSDMPIRPLPRPAAFWVARFQSMSRKSGVELASSPELIPRTKPMKSSSLFVVRLVKLNGPEKPL